MGLGARLTRSGSGLVVNRHNDRPFNSSTDRYMLLNMACDFEMSSEELDRLSPILHLPPELFLDIASILVREWPPQTPRSHTPLWKLARPGSAMTSVRLSSGSLGWMNITHVCRHWRELCIDTQMLWTRWIGRLPSALPEILSRAGDGTALHVDIDIHEDFDAPGTLGPYGGIWAALPPLSMIRTMTWKVPDCDIANLVADRLCSVSAKDALIHLLDLDIHVADEDVFVFRRQGDALYAPTLRTFTLGQAWIQSLHAPSLTVLELRRPSKILGQNDFYDLLVGCPMLTSLSIVKGYFMPYKERGQNALPLCHLEHFRLDGPISATGIDREGVLLLFTRVLLIPPAAAIEVAVAPRELPDEDFARSIFAFCVDNITQVESPNILCLYASTIVISLGTSTVTAPYTTWRAPTLPDARKRAQITCGLDAAELIFCFIQPDFDRYMSYLNGITVLSLDPPWLLDDGAYRHAIHNLLRALPALCIIRVASNSSWDELLEPLGSVTPDTGGVLLPDLEALWLDGAYQSEMEIDGYDPAMDRVQLHALTNTLLARTRLLSEAGMGRSPRTIFLHGFDSVSQDDACVRLLRSEVAEVVFVGANL